ncbi:unnamed protein product [Spirodela intermedia]|uniref:Uncharacterized protein n=1 Tax=Spirodela intermedia TaxID=51605 RepID=A0A7I8KIR9_SPIIN|nr:unnamed protein product [Spirodela intermedia]
MPSPERFKVRLPRPPAPTATRDSSPVSLLLDECGTIEGLRQAHCRMIRAGAAPGASERRLMVVWCCARAREPGDMKYARLLFEECPQATDVFLWNTVIRGYSGCNSPEPAALTYLEMRRRGFDPDDHSLPFLLKSFTRETASLLGKELHAHALKFGLASNAFTQNALIHTYCLSGQVDAARAIFDRSLDRDVITWNAMISGYNRNKRYELSCKLFDEMKKVRLKPTWVTLLSALSACTKLKHLRAGERLHREMEEARLVPGNLVLENALIGMYAECGAIGAALKLFDGMKVRDVISWTSVIKGLADSGEVDRARFLFEETPHRDLICWTAMTDGYVKANRFKEALELFRRMQTVGVKPDAFTIVGVLTACAHLGALEAGEWVRIYVGRRKVRADVAVGNAFIDMYSKCGVVERALEVFGGMERRDKFTWTVMIVGLAVNGRGEEALHLFIEMLRAGEKPDSVTYVGVLQACVHSGLVGRGRRLFSGMLRGAHGVAPQVAHYGCMVDLLGRAGRLREALEVINGMPMAPNSIVWGSLLGACRLHRDQEMAEMAAERLLELEPRDSAAYVLLADLYAKCSRWEEVRGVREKILEKKGVKKTPGCSLIEMNGEIHEFVAGDATHLRSVEIMAMAEEMDRELRLAGYVPDMSEVFLDVL